MFLKSIVYDQPKKYALCIDIQALVITVKYHLILLSAILAPLYLGSSCAHVLMEQKSREHINILIVAYKVQDMYFCVILYNLWLFTTNFYRMNVLID
jgi:hypothetical protein